MLVTLGATKRYGGGGIAPERSRGSEIMTVTENHTLAPIEQGTLAEAIERISRGELHYTHARPPSVGHLDIAGVNPASISPEQAVALIRTAVLRQAPITNSSWSTLRVTGPVIVHAARDVAVRHAVMEEIGPCVGRIIELLAKVERWEMQADYVPLLDVLCLWAAVDGHLTAEQLAAIFSARGGAILRTPQGARLAHHPNAPIDVVARRLGALLKGTGPHASSVRVVEELLMGGPRAAEYIRHPMVHRTLARKMFGVRWTVARLHSAALLATVWAMAMTADEWAELLRYLSCRALGRRPTDYAREKAGGFLLRAARAAPPEVVLALDLESPEVRNIASGGTLDLLRRTQEEARAIIQEAAIEAGENATRVIPRA